MSQVIWKFTVPIEDDFFHIEMPVRADILCVQAQGEKAFVWARVDSGAEKVRRSFCLVGTGHEIPMKDLRYIGTFQLSNGSLVFHLFEQQS